MTETTNVRSETGTGPGPLPETSAELVPGTSMALHRFPHGSLAGQPWYGADGVPVDLVNRHAREIALAITTWQEDAKLKVANGGSSVFDRSAYVAPDNVFKQMQVARNAVENDDIVGGIADGTEAIAFGKNSWESSSLDDADIFNQWSAMVNLDNFIRVCWRELLTHSQYVGARWWGFKDFKVRGTGAPKMKKIDGPPNPDGTPGEPHWEPERNDADGSLKKGQRRKKEYQGVYCPIGLTVLDSTRVVPMGSLMFGMETLVWTATKREMVTWTGMQNGEIPRSADPIVANLFVGRYNPDDEEREMLVKLGINSTRVTDLLILNPAYVWRHTLTRPHYKPWADIRLKRAMPWLDMKQQALAADRVALVGNANYILLVRKGEEKAPASQEELDNLNENFAYIAKLPVVIGDHTLQIDIISPKQDHTLKGERYDVIDGHIRDTMLNALGGSEGGGDSRQTSDSARAKAIALGLTNRRHGLKRDFEANFAREIVEHPFNAGKFEGEPNLTFTPRRITLETNQAELQALIALSARGDVSRKTTLAETLDLDEATEAQYREMEQVWYDPVFKTATPFNGNDNPMAPDGGPGNDGGGALPPGAGGGGKPPGGKPKSTPASPKAPRAPRPARGKTRT